METESESEGVKEGKKGADFTFCIMASGSASNPVTRSPMPTEKTRMLVDWPSSLRVKNIMSMEMSPMTMTTMAATSMMMKDQCRYSLSNDVTLPSMAGDSWRDMFPEVICGDSDGGSRESTGASPACAAPEISSSRNLFGRKLQTLHSTYSSQREVGEKGRGEN
ncbi:hypothetical protein BgiBS90_000899 [Biomphalaria glabrata]|nr:hypothetical protein BgiBS90_000899 [Biomphalaria glabrata]